MVTEWNGKSVRSYRIEPEDFGLKRAPLKEVCGGSVQDNAQFVRDVLSGKPGPRRDIVLMNAAAGLVTCGRARNWREGAEMAAHAIDSGSALGRLQTLADLSQKLA